MGFVRSWLSPCRDDDGQSPDIYAIGFQEINDFISETGKESEWEEIVKGSLSPCIRYKKLEYIRMVGILLIIFVKDSLLHHITNVETKSVGTGFLNKMGNKGAVAIRFNFRKTSMCFVNSHLAHGTDFERRNRDFHEICFRMSFMQNSTIEDHDMVYWFGDTNYRINPTFERATIKSLLLEGKRAKLLEKDQLKEQQFAGNAFVGYNEGRITFEPTYKYDRGTNDWDTSNLKRTPAWTDRVLWKGDHIKQVWYQSDQEMKISDHKPVSALFQSDIKFINEEKKHEIFNELFNNFNNQEYKQLPRVQLTSTEPLDYNILHFDSVKFNEPIIKKLVIQNISKVPVKFRFKKKGLTSCRTVAKSWLAVTPLKGTIMPNEKCNLDVQIHVRAETARELTITGDTKLSDILILRIFDLKDIFITVTGMYRRSSFGSKIEALCKMRIPIGRIPLNQLIKLEESLDTRDLHECITMSSLEKKPSIIERDFENENASDENEPYEIPKEIWYLCNLISKLDGFQSPRLFQESGSPQEFIALRNWLDTGFPEEGPNVSVHSVAETLLIFLNCLSEPLIPDKLFNRCLEYSSGFNESHTILPLLPPSHKRVFNYMRQFLHQVLRYSTTRDYDEQMLAKIFGQIVLRENECVDCNLNEENACCVHGTSVMAMTQRRLIENQKTSFMYQFLRRR